MLIVLTNDDGIEAKGLRTLHRRLARDHEVVVVAPAVEASACSHGLSLHRPLRIRKHARDAYSVDGTPVDCVTLAVFQILRKRRPDLIISGINQGQNLGTDVLYSGTVAGAIEGAILGIPSMAVSLVSFTSSEFEPAAEFAALLAGMLRKKRLPEDTCLNVNVPTQVTGAPFPVRLTRLGRRRYTKVIKERMDPRGKKYYWIGGDPVELDLSDDVDSAAIREGCISVTPLKLDLTAHEHFKTVGARLKLPRSRRGGKPAHIG